METTVYGFLLTDSETADKAASNDHTHRAVTRGPGNQAEGEDEHPACTEKTTLKKRRISFSNNFLRRNANELI